MTSALTDEKRIRTGVPPTLNNSAGFNLIQSPFKTSFRYPPPFISLAQATNTHAVKAN